MTCCGPFNKHVAGSGGFTVSGSATAATDTYTPSGGITAAGSATVSVPQNVYDSYAFVYHLKEQGTGAANEYKNSQGWLGGQGAGGTDAKKIPEQVNGIFYKANSFAGVDYIQCPEDSMPDGGPITVSLWAQITGKYQTRYWFSRGYTKTATGEGWSLCLGHTAANLLTASAQVVGSTKWLTYTATGSTAIDSCWHHVALVWQPGSSLKIYLDGSLEKSVSVAETSLVPSISGHYIGRVDSRNYAYGIVAEVKISPSARDQVWLAAEADNLCGGAGFYTVSSGTNQRYTTS